MKVFVEQPRLHVVVKLEEHIYFVVKAQKFLIFTEVTPTPVQSISYGVCLCVFNDR